MSEASSIGAPRPRATLAGKISAKVGSNTSPDPTPTPVLIRPERKPAAARKRSDWVSIAISSVKYILLKRNKLVQKHLKDRLHSLILSHRSIYDRVYRYIVLKRDCFSLISGAKRMKNGTAIGMCF